MRRSYAILSYSAAVLIVAMVALDTLGLVTDTTLLWAAGARLATTAIVLAAAAALAGALARRAGLLPSPTSTPRKLLVLAALLVLALARWVRGHPEVRPDPPIYAAELLGAAVLLVLLLWNRRIGRMAK